MMSSYMWLSQPTTNHNNPGIQILSNNENVLEQFMDNIKDDPAYETLNGFNQGKSANWRYVEFWTKDHDGVIDLAIKISSDMKLEIHSEDPSREIIRELGI